ncbi:MAG TPA: aminotransferase class I/II-fold pyridoxal phosphate-dependent enzyme [Candidatus Andersenbacteria bacterium]|nr:MAG: hypothetical protein A2854_01800 [Parcubacteria group bacterium RIFCSPHIGHO2_01_FULL_56_18]HLD25686.1 aminotransferase class I/II-fold pyridoxal phosphate-dependent enzyme [Candidatus Andersenbacteria bacterium]
MLTTSLAPNTQADDIQAAAASLLSPWRWRDSERLPAVAQQLEAMLPQHHAVLTSSGRAAIWQTLKAFGIGAGDEVIIQAFTCLAVPAAVSWSGAKPTYADINKQTYNLDPASVAARITPRTKAIIVQHTFGIPGPIAELQALATQHKLILIEDLAHALGGNYQNQPLGTLGDATILSFGRDKTISSVFGGAVICGDQKVIARLAAAQASLSYPPAQWVAQQLLHPLVVPVLNRLYFTAGLGKVLLVAAQKLHLLSLAVSASEKRGQKPSHVHYRFAPALAPLLQHQLRKLTAFTAHRRRLARHYAAALPHRFSEQQLSEAAWLRFPLLLKNRDQVFRAARQRKMLLGDWYTSPVTPGVSPNISHYQPGSCPVAEEVSREIINLPTHINISEQQAQGVIAFMQQQS